MTENHDKLKDSIAAYCLGALGQDEQQALESHLDQGCHECQEILTGMSLVVQSMPFSVPGEKPPADLKQRILAAVSAEKYAAPAVVSELKEDVARASRKLVEAAKRRWMRATWALSFAMVLSIIGFGVYTQSMQKRVALLENQVVIGGQLVEELESELDRQRRILNVVNSPNIRIVNLDGLDVSPSSQGVVYWNPVQSQAMFYAFNLPQPPSGKEYQLWMLRGNQPVDAGVFSLNEQGKGSSAIQTLSDSAALTAFAVTLEPKGGSPQPTGDMYLLGVVTKG